MCKYCELNVNRHTSGMDFGALGTFRINQAKNGYFIVVSTDDPYGLEPESVFINYCPMCGKKLANW